MGASFKFIVRKQALKKDGSTRLYLRIIVDKKVAYIVTNILVLPINFNVDSQVVSKKDGLHHDKNLCITEIKTKLTRCVLEYEKSGSPLFVNDLLQAYKQQNIVGLLEYSKQVFEQKKLTKTRQSQIRKSIEYLLEHKPGTNLYNLNNSTLNSFKNYLATKVNSNTVISRLSQIRSIYNAAYNDGIIKYKPFEKFTVGVGTTKEHFFTLDELFYLKDNIQVLSVAKQKILSTFLFACFTGLRFSDVIRLKKENIKPFESGFYIEFVQGKTKKKNIVPLSKFALKMFDINNSGFVFPQLSNQHYNRDLKEIAAFLKFDKYISFHVSRHTFITISQHIGIGLSEASKLAGHTTIKTTQGYTHHNLSSLFNSICKWNNLSSAGDGGLHSKTV